MDAKKFLARFISLLILVGTLVWRASGQSIAYETSNVELKLHGTLGTVWKVGQGEISEAFVGVQAKIQVQNISVETQRPPVFYAEYFDHAGRFCFALVFSPSWSVEKRSESFDPGEVRDLLSSTYYENPASKPALADVYEVAEEGPSPDNTLHPAGSVGRSPIMLDSINFSGQQWGSVALGGEVEGGKSPLLDLIVAYLTVDEQGSLGNVQILFSTNDSVHAWFREFVQHQRFQPARRYGVAERAGVLLLVRAAVSLKCWGVKPLAPGRSLAIKTYVEGLRTTEVPPVISILMEPQSDEYWTRPSAGDFGQVAVGAGWTKPIRTLVSDKSPGTMLPEGPRLRKLVPPPQSYVCP